MKWTFPHPRHARFSSERHCSWISYEVFLEVARGDLLLQFLGLFHSSWNCLPRNTSSLRSLQCLQLCCHTFRRIFESCSPPNRLLKATLKTIFVSSKTKWSGLKRTPRFAFHECISWSSWRLLKYNTTCALHNSRHKVLINQDCLRKRAEIS